MLGPTKHARVATAIVSLLALAAVIVVVVSLQSDTHSEAIDAGAVVLESDSVSDVLTKGLVSAVENRGDPDEAYIDRSIESLENNAAMGDRKQFSGQETSGLNANPDPVDDWSKYTGNVDTEMENPPRLKGDLDYWPEWKKGQSDQQPRQPLAQDGEQTNPASKSKLALSLQALGKLWNDGIWAGDKKLTNAEVSAVSDTFEGECDKEEEAVRKAAEEERVKRQGVIGVNADFSKALTAQHNRLGRLSEASRTRQDLARTLEEATEATRKARAYYNEAIARTAAAKEELVRLQAIGEDHGIAHAAAVVAQANREEQHAKAVSDRMFRNRIAAEEAVSRATKDVLNARALHDRASQLTAMADAVRHAARADVSSAESAYEAAVAAHVSCQARMREAIDKIHQIEEEAQAKSAYTGRAANEHALATYVTDDSSNND